MEISKEDLQKKLLEFLNEDVGQGDITTNAIVPANTQVHAQIIVKEPAFIAGLFEVKIFFEMLGVKFTALVEDGTEVPAGTVIADLKGDGRVILTAERTVLNILMRMSGIATVTRRLVKKVQNAKLDVRIAATRKTAPGLRFFDKKAVLIGGGFPHRLRLDEEYLIKDNHIAIASSVDKSVKRVRVTSGSSKKVEVEVKTRDQAVEAARLRVDIIMLDNMTLNEAEMTLKALKKLELRDKVLIEISGGVTERNLLDYARLKPDFISLGSITHSVKAVDISLEIIEVET